MSEKFKAVVLNQSGDKFSREIKALDKSFFKVGDVLVRVDYSGLNYKDAIILNNGAKLIKEYPHIPGIDFSGHVKESDNADFKPGDDVGVTGCRVGEIYPGGYAQLVIVKSEFLVKTPKVISNKDSIPHYDFYKYLMSLPLIFYNKTKNLERTMNVTGG